MIEMMLNPSGRAIRNCKKKQAFETKQQADYVAARRMMLTPQAMLYVYQCNVCGAWHLTGKKNTNTISQEAFDKFSNDDELIGKKLGRLLVGHKTSEKTYSVKCDCGIGEVRSRKDLKSKRSSRACCKWCRIKVMSYRAAIKKATGVTVTFADAYDIKFCGDDFEIMSRSVNSKPVLRLK